MVTYLLIILAAISNTLMDLSSEDKFKGRWWNKSQGWKNKWKLGHPKNGPKFWGSTTIFVGLTDGWHLFQFCFHTFWQLALAIQTEQWIVTFIFVKILFSITFEIIYSQLKNKLKIKMK